VILHSEIINNHPGFLACCFIIQAVNMVSFSTIEHTQIEDKSRKIITNIQTTAIAILISTYSANVKLSLCLIKQQALKTYGEVEA
jgi:hypothetical protein